MCRLPLFDAIQAEIMRSATERLAGLGEGRSDP
jgi:hypothetical protein